MAEDVACLWGVEIRLIHLHSRELQIVMSKFNLYYYNPVVFECGYSMRLLTSAKDSLWHIPRHLSRYQLNSTELMKERGANNGCFS
jgi:hypothetical protein